MSQHTIVRKKGLSESELCHYSLCISNTLIKEPIFKRKSIHYDIQNMKEKSSSQTGKI